MTDKINNINAKSSYDPSDMDVDPAELASLGLDALGKPRKPFKLKNLKNIFKKEKAVVNPVAPVDYPKPTTTGNIPAPASIDKTDAANSSFLNQYQGMMAAEQPTGEVENATATVPETQPVPVAVSSVTDGRDPEPIKKPSSLSQPKEAVPTPAKKVEAVAKPAIAVSKPKLVSPVETPTPVVEKSPEVVRPVTLSLLDIVHHSPAFRAQGPAALVSRIKPEILPGLCKSIESKIPGYVNNLLLRYAPNLPATQRGIMTREFIMTVGRWMATKAMPEDMTTVLTWFQSGKGVDVLLSSLSRILSFPSQQIAGILKTIQTKATVTTSPAVATSSQNIDIHTIWQNRFPGQEAFISRVMAMKQSQKKPPLTSPVAGPQIPSYISSGQKLITLPDVVIQAKAENKYFSSVASKETGKSNIQVAAVNTPAVTKEEKNTSLPSTDALTNKTMVNSLLPSFDKYFLVDKSKPYPKVIGIEYITPLPKAGSPERKAAEKKQNEEVTLRKKEAIRYLTYKGLSPVAAVGVLANMVHESSLLNVGAIGDRGKSHGLCQWRDNRRSSMETFVSNVSLSRDWKDFYGQLDYIFEELNGKYTTAMRGLQKATTPYQAAHAFCTHFEAPTDTPTQAANRGDSAMGVYRTLTKNLALQEEIGGSKEQMAQFARNDITVHGDSGAVLLANYQGGYKNKLTRENEGKSSKRILEHMPQSLGKATIVLAGRNDIHPGGQETRENIMQIAQYIASHGSTPILPLLPEPKLTPIKGFAGPDDRYKERETYRQYMLSLNGTPIGNTGKRMIVVDCGNVEIASYDNLHPVPKSLDAIITQAISNPIA